MGKGRIGVQFSVESHVEKELQRNSSSLGSVYNVYLRIPSGTIE